MKSKERRESEEQTALTFIVEGAIAIVGMRWMRERELEA